MDGSSPPGTLLSRLVEFPVSTPGPLSFSFQDLPSVYFLSVRAIERPRGGGIDADTRPDIGQNYGEDTW